jgi:hypothetical protein
MSYRDQRQVLWERKVELERLQAANEGQRKAMAAHDVDIDAELKTLREQLRALPQATQEPKRLLDQLRVASPCSAKWDDMIGTERTRHCVQCNKNVYNISAMTRDEAEEFLAAQVEVPCVRYFQRQDGTILTQDCPVGVRRKRLKVIGATVVAASCGVAATVAMFSRPITHREIAGGGFYDNSHVMGEMAEPSHFAPTVGSSAPLPEPPNQVKAESDKGEHTGKRAMMGAPVAIPNGDDKAAVLPGSKPKQGK